MQEENGGDIEKVYHKSLFPHIIKASTIEFLIVEAFIAGFNYKYLLMRTLYISCC